MSDQLSIVEAGPECHPELSQWFTDPRLARQLVDLIGEDLDELVDACAESVEFGQIRVLEPSAGRGNLVRAVLDRCGDWAWIDAVDIDPRWAPDLAGLGHTVHVDIVDYLARPAPAALYHFGVCNVPFDGGEEGAHIAKMLDECERIAALLPTRSLHGAERYAQIWHRFDARRPERDWYIRQEARCTLRPKFGERGGTDEIVLLDLSREPGPCLPGWL